METNGIFSLISIFYCKNNMIYQGHLEPGGDIFDAMIREAKEEIGINIKRENMQIVHIYHHFNKDKLKFVFEVTSYSGEIYRIIMCYDQ